MTHPLILNGAITCADDRLERRKARRVSEEGTDPSVSSTASRSTSSGVGSTGRRGACVMRRPDRSHLVALCDLRISLKGQQLSIPNSEWERGQRCSIRKGGVCKTTTVLNPGAGLALRQATPLLGRHESRRRLRSSTGFNTLKQGKYPSYTMPCSSTRFCDRSKPTKYWTMSRVITWPGTSTGMPGG